MKRTSLIILLLLGAVTALAQPASQIRKDVSFLQAEGQAASLYAADSTALMRLSAKVAAHVGISTELGATYMEDLRRASSRIVEEHYNVLRYLAVTDVESVFAPRRERVLQLESRGAKTGDPQFYTLAYTLARSLPAFPADSLESLRQKASGSWTMEDFVSREADAILAALEPRSDQTQRLSRPAPPPIPQPQVEHFTVTDTVVVERDLGRIEIEHVFSRRDTMVIISGTPQESNVATTARPERRTTPREPQPIMGFVLAQVSILPDLSYGVMLGLGASRWGGYVSGRSNFHLPEFDYDCLSDGSTAFGQIWSSGQRSVGRYTFTGGAWFKLANWLSVFAGAGYGSRRICWQDAKGNWARVTDYSATGVVAEAGVLFQPGRIALSLGGEAIAFRQFALTLGAGFCF